MSFTKLSYLCFMKRMNLVFAFLFITMNIVGKAQDPHFTQYFSTPINLNPAFAGYEGCSRVSGGVRDQWPNVSGSFLTSVLSYDQYVKPVRGGLSINYMWDSEGDGILQSHSLMIAYAPSFKIFNQKLLISPAIEVGCMGKFLDWDKMTFGDQIDPRYGFAYDTTRSNPSHKYLFDLNAGILISHGALVYGAAIHHINQPDEGFFSKSQLPMRYSGHFSWVYSFNDNIKLSPSLCAQKQAVFEEILPSLSFYFHGVKAGTGARFGLHNTDCVIIMLGYTCKWFSAGYSYDYTVSKLTNATGGSHEIMLQAKINCKNKSDKRKGVGQINF